VTVEYISIKLGALRAALRRLIIAIGLLRVLLMALGVFAAAYVLDWYAHLPPVTRISVMIAGGGILLAAIYQYLVRPLGASLSDDSLALLVEKRQPQFNDRLISAVQLSREKENPEAARFNSPGLVRRIVADANDMAATADFGSVLRAAQLKGLAAAGLVCFVFAGAYVSLKHDLVGVFLARMAYPYSDVEWPRKTTLTLPGRDRTTYVAKGDDVAVDVLCEGHVPSRVTLHYRFASSEWGKRRMKRTGERVFRAHFSAVAEDFSFHLEGGDHITEVYRVKVIDRPHVQTIDVAYEFPKYTGMAAYKQTSGLGDVTGVVGTKVSIAARTNKPVKPDGARIVFDDGTELPMRIVTDQTPPNGGSLLAGRFELKPGPGTYKIEVVDLGGLSDTNPVTYRLRVLVDNPPVVRIIEPKGNREVTPNATINVVAESTDERDFGGIRETRFTMKNGEQGPGIMEAFADTVPGSTLVRNAGSWDLAPLAPKEGDVITCYIEAEDYNDVSGPGIGRSDAFYLTIISPAQLAAKLDNKLKQVKRDIENIRKIQDQIKAKTDEIVDALRATEKLTGDQTRRLNSTAALQKEMGKRAARTAVNFSEIAKEMAENKIGAPEDLQRLESFRQALDNVGKQQMPRAAAKLAQAQGNDDPLRSLQDASVTQGDILDELSSLLKRMSKTEDLDELIRRAGRLVLKQKSINQRTKSTGNRTLGQTPDEMAEEDKAIIRGLERDQSSAHEEMKDLESGMNRFVKNTSDKDPAAAGAVQKAFEEAARDQIRKKMRAASDLLGNMKPVPAVEEQQKVYEGLEKLLDNLNEAKRKQYADIEQLKREMESAAAKIEKLIRDQQAHKRASDPQRTDALEKARGRLDEMIKKQQGLNKDTEGQAQKARPVAGLAAQQQSLAEEARQLAQQLAQLSKPAAQETARAAEAMNDAREILEKNPPAVAQASQATATDRLKKARELLDKLAEQQQAEKLAEEQERIRHETQELTRKLRDLSEQGKSLNEELSEQAEGAASSTSRAEERMNEAEEKLKRDDRRAASGEQESAIRHLQEAKKKLDKALAELAKKEREKKLFEIGKVLARMLGRQREVNVETIEIDKVAVKEGELPHPWLMKLRETAEKQGALKKNAGVLLKKLADEGCVVFSYAMADVFTDMSDARKRLSDEDTGWATQQIQKDIERTLSELVEALEQEYEQAKQGGGGGGGAGGAGGKEPPLVPPLAQLKMLRTLEVNIFEATKRYEEEKALGNMNPVLVKKRVERLGEKQENVSKTARKLARELDQMREETQ